MQMASPTSRIENNLTTYTKIHDNASSSAGNEKYIFVILDTIFSYQTLLLFEHTYPILFVHATKECVITCRKNDYSIVQHIKGSHIYSEDSKFYNLWKLPFTAENHYDLRYLEQNKIVDTLIESVKRHKVVYISGLPYNRDYLFDKLLKSF